MSSPVSSHFPIGSLSDGDDDLYFLLDFIGNDEAPVPVLDPAEVQQVPPVMENGGPTGGRRKRAIGKRGVPRAKKQRSPSEGGGEDGVVPAQGGGKRLWAKERDQGWWEWVSGPECSEEEFRREFRMSRATMDALCEELRGTVAKEDTTLRAAVPVRQRVAVCVWRLATGESLREVSSRFGIGISTCHKIVIEVCGAMSSELMPKVVRWPEDTTAAAARFEGLTGLPNVIGALHNAHFAIGEPKNDAERYYNARLTKLNQKSSYSVTVQGVVDGDSVFRDVCIGHAGSLTDVDVLALSVLGKEGARLLHNRLVVGGAGYPLMEWMLVPYAAGGDLTLAQRKFNERAAIACALARAGFVRLKARWKCLRRRADMKLQDLPSVIGACIVLHNICERNGEVLDDVLLRELDDDSVDDDDTVVPAENVVRSESAAMARDSIAHSLLHGGAGDAPVLPSGGCS